MAKPTLYFGGVPTGPDVDKLLEHYGVPKIGTRIPYDELAAVINQSASSNRFKSVTAQWRRKLDRQHNIVLRCIPGEAFEVADSHARVDLASRGYKMGVRKVVRCSNIAARTDRSTLSQEEARVCEHLERVASAHLLAAKTSAKEVRFQFESKGAIQ
ncbi:hypothetical protein [Geothrix campi]|uniref:hypothetical protein n=1 Tax=Geothrix campi TaxID=2966450 RepID=UPI0021472F24|nr:hypothetical protein [Geothrix sp. SG10]